MTIGDFWIPSNCKCRKKAIQKRKLISVFPVRIRTEQRNAYVWHHLSAYHLQTTFKRVWAFDFVIEAKYFHSTTAERREKKELAAFKAFQSIKHEPFDYPIDSYWKTFEVIRATYESGGKKLFWSRLTWQSRFVAFLYSATADGITLFTSSTSTFRHRIVTSLSISWKRP